jgi:hypothetical protein
MFSPELFFDYYVANKWQINTLQLWRCNLALFMLNTPFADSPVDIYNYRPGGFRMEGQLEESLYTIIVVATKSDASTANVIPQQQLWKAAWKAGDTIQGDELDVALFQDMNKHFADVKIPTVDSAKTSAKRGWGLRRTLNRRTPQWMKNMLHPWQLRFLRWMAQFGMAIPQGRGIEHPVVARY